MKYIYRITFLIIFSLFSMNQIFGNNTAPAISQNKSASANSLNSEAVFDNEIILEISHEITCNGAEDGELTATINVSPPCDTLENPDLITYAWMKDDDVLANETTATLENIGPGEYQVSISFYNDDEQDPVCTYTSTIEVEELQEVSANFTGMTPVKCNGGNDGRAKVSGMGGVIDGDYFYLWNDANETTDANAINLEAGMYTVTITDNNGCTASNTITIEEPTLLVPNIAMTSHIPCLAGFGLLEVNPEGGTPEYSYEWENGSDTNTLESENPGTYSVTITDNNGCSVVATEELILGTAPQISSFSEVLTFRDGEENEVEYTFDLPEATLEWEILNPVNVNTSAPSFMSEGQSPNPISLTLFLEEDKIPGSIILQVRPKINLCIGNPVQTAIHIYPEGSPIHIPEIFSPNQDGTNDTWEIAVPPNDSPNNYCINIYSKNGQKVYEAKSLEVPWTGEECPEGTYYYIIEDKMTKSTFRGVVSILR